MVVDEMFVSTLKALNFFKYRLCELIVNGISFSQMGNKGGLRLSFLFVPSWLLCLTFVAPRFGSSYSNDNPKRSRGCLIFSYRSTSSIFISWVY
nr:hypothetical protein CFP56_71536 [Quercus suber]